MPVELDVNRIASHLAGLVQCATVSYADPSKVDNAEFHRLHSRLEQYYPLLHQRLEKRVINGNGLLYRWPGKSDKKPILLMAHLDVVPASEKGWIRPPFSGDISRGCVWGRGAIDIKCVLCCEMEAVEYLLERGYTPAHDVYLAYGCDEEVNSKHCARDIAAMLEHEGVRLAMVLDEGDSFVPGEIYDATGRTLACIGVCEKGYLDIVLSLEGDGGHASNPPEISLIGELCRAVAAVQKSPLPARLPVPVQQFYQRLMPFMKNRRLARLLDDVEGNMAEICSLLEKTRRGNASVRTTTAATMAQGSPASNVLPQRVSATINFRLSPHDTVESVIEHCRSAIGNERVRITPLQAENASASADTTGREFLMLADVVTGIYPDVIVLPTMLFGATDSRSFQRICGNIFKFLPIRACMDLGHTIHSQNERMPLEGLEQGTNFFIALIQKAEWL